MRIISGRFKGRRLADFKGDIRPTSDRLRESLFDCLGESVERSSWLDLFAGSGAVGIEALSRGARHVVFNDREPVARMLLKKNLGVCGVDSGVEIWGLDAITFLRKWPPGDPFTHIFLDPPYEYPRIGKLLRTVIDSTLFNPDETVLMLEIFKKTRVDLPGLNLKVARNLKTGDSVILILRGHG